MSLSQTARGMTREQRREELTQHWNQGRNYHLAVLSLFHRYTGGTRELSEGMNVIDEILDIEFGAETESRGDENAA